MNTNEIYEYYVDEDKRTVAAVLTVPASCVMEEMCNVVNKGCGTHFVFEGVNFHANMLVKGTYTGKAVCHPNDEWNVEKGMRIAKLKAIRAYLNDRKVITDRLVKMFADVAVRVEDMAKHTEYAKKHIEDYLDEND